MPKLDEYDEINSAYKDIKIKFNSFSSKYGKYFEISGCIGFMIAMFMRNFSMAFVLFIAVIPDWQDVLKYFKKDENKYR
jgi:hypothetical protein